MSRLPETVFPDTVLPEAQLAPLQNSHTATPALLVMVLPVTERPVVGPRLFWVFNPGW